MKKLNKKQKWNFKDFPPDPLTEELMPGLEIQYMVTDETVNGNNHEAVFGHCVIPPGQMHDRHGHTRSAEILYTIKGELISGYVDDKGNDVELECKPGDVTFVPPNVIHWTHNKSVKKAEFVFVYTCAHSIPDSGYYDEEK